MTWNRDAVVEQALNETIATHPEVHDYLDANLRLAIKRDVATVVPGIVRSVIDEMRGLHQPKRGKELLPNGVAIPWDSCSCGFRTHSACPTIRLCDEIEAQIKAALRADS